ncbi:MAG: apolipoprotein N-acyltransferase [Treponema sp.]|nr:apolipoprotein N-acyltransferase [Treponema sp.]
MKRILQVFFALFSSIILSLAIQNEFIPFGSPFLGLFALVPLYYAISQSTSYAQAGLLFGIQISFTNIFSSFWLGFFRGFAIFTLGGTSVAYFIFGLVFGRIAYIPFAKNAVKTLRRTSGNEFSDIFIRIFHFATVWTLYEWFKSSGFLAYPWGTVSMSAYRWPLITQIAAITGTYGITFLFALFSSIFAEGCLLLAEIPHHFMNATTKAYKYCAATYILLIAMSVGYGGYSLINQKQPIKSFNAVIVQQNADPWSSNEEECILASMDITVDAIDNSETKPDIIIWSEAVLSRPMPVYEKYYKRFPYNRPLIPFIDEVDIPFLIGGPVQVDFFGTPRLSNSAIFFDRDGNYIESYGKRWLVPFAEIIPYQEHKWMQKIIMKLAGFSSGWVPGKENKIFTFYTNENESINFSTPICFEDAFPPICRQMYYDGAEVFVNITNDSWSKTVSAELQHFAIASYRCIEFRMPMIRCANSGYSVVMDTTGKIIDDMPLFEQAGLTLNVPVYESSKTVYGVLGNWLPMLLLALCFVYGILTAYGLIDIPRFDILPKEQLISARYKPLSIIIAPCIFIILCLCFLALPIANGTLIFIVKALLALSIFKTIINIKQSIFHKIILTNHRVVLVSGFLYHKVTDVLLSQIVCISATKNKIVIKDAGGNKLCFFGTKDAQAFRLNILQTIIGKK